VKIAITNKDREYLLPPLLRMKVVKQKRKEIPCKTQANAIAIKEKMKRELRLHSLKLRREREAEA
jgi:hypothetical protein